MRLTLDRYLVINRINPRWFPNVFYAFMMSMPIYLASYRNLDVSTDYFEEVTTFGVADEFDFIIVGGGSTGSIVANRLSQNYSVLLLEAGGEPHPFHMIPMFALSLLNFREIDWRHRTVPQKNSTFAQNHRESLLSAGKALGGTSNINFMIHSRGNPRDFDVWAEMLGDSDWNYDNVLPYFKKYENYIEKPDIKIKIRNKNLRNESEPEPEELHGYEGEMTIQVPSYTGMGDIYLRAAEDLGYERADLNGRFTEGFDYTHSPVKMGRRQSAYTAFVEPIRNRPTLTIRKFAFATKVLFGDDNEAYGVEYNHHRIRRQAYARREVILSAGAINSPKLLLLSGIGQKEHLEELGIPVRYDLPTVGQNLQDHACTYLGPFFVNDSITLLADRDLRVTTFPNFLANGAGPLSHSAVPVMGFFSTDIAKSAGEGDWPDVQIIMSGAAICNECDKFLAHGFNIQEDVLTKYYRHAKGRDSFLQLVSNARPLARGEMKLRSADPYAPAVIDPKYLDNEHDLQVTIAGVKRAVEIAENTTTLQKYDCHFTEEPFPGCEDVEFRSDAYWECYIRQYTVSLHHLVGTCSMGKSEKEGVVDKELRVFGTKRLRVIDASVMPKVPVGNTNAPSIMIGEKGSDYILKLWEKEEQQQQQQESELTEPSPSQPESETESSTAKLQHL